MLPTILSKFPEDQMQSSICSCLSVGHVGKVGYEANCVLLAVSTNVGMHGKRSNEWQSVASPETTFPGTSNV